MAVRYQTSNNSMELRDYLSLLNRRKWIIVLAVLLVAGTALVASFLQTPVYEGKARLFLETNASVFDLNGAQQLSPARVQTEIQVLQSAPVKAAVREKLGAAPPVSVTQVGQTEVLEVRVRAPQPLRAAEFTDAYVTSYLDYRRKQAVDDLVAKAKEIQRVLDDLKNQVADLDARAATTTTRPPNAGGPAASNSERDALISQQALFKQRLDQLDIDTSVTSANASAATPAEASDTPVSPRPVRNGVLGVSLGLILGIGAALLIEHLDDSIKSKEDLEIAANGLPVLGMIPAVASWKNRNETRVISRVEPSSPAAEAYRSLRTSINFLGVDRSMRVLQITSSNASEGKTTTIANLAVALARAGERVVIVNCDLRRPRIHDFFDLPDSVGFTNVFLGEMPISAALQSVPGEPNLRILASGRLPPNPSELLSSPRTEQIFSALKSQNVMVLIDCPPVLPVTDAAVLSSRVDGTVLVASAGSTTGKDLGRALELLGQVGAPILGTVLNGVTAEGGYGYQYGYYTPPPPEDDKKSAGNGRKAAKAARKSESRSPAGG
ncbi:MAG: polysaccharide biosynthesis tyrosine autokinase [Acidimicrobiales bacterium]